MTLSDRLRDAGVSPSDLTDPLRETPPDGESDQPENVIPMGPGRTKAAREPSGDSPDPLMGLQLRAQHALFSRLGSRLYDATLSLEKLQQYVTDELTAIVDAESIPLSRDQQQGLVEAIAVNVLGYGPLEEYLDDDRVTEVMVAGEGPVYVERDGQIEETSSRFVSLEHHRRVIERIVSAVGRRIDESSPMVDARLGDGSRVNAIIPPLAVDGPTLTIRKFSKRPFEVDDLIGFKTLTPRIAGFIEACVRARTSILVSGGTGSGKTTLLNVLSGFIGARERIVTIEDSVELQLRQKHVIRLESRPPNAEGKGEVTIRDLVRNALRMRPDRIIVGEVRGGEALDMLQAMNTGHEGSLTTLHANTPRDALSRLETMVLMAGMDLPLTAVREQVASALDLIVHVGRLSDGSRRVLQVSEVTGMEGDVIQLSDLYTFDWGAGVDQNGNFKGSGEPTGLRPTFDKRFRDLGIDLPVDIFGDPTRIFDTGHRP